MRLWNGTQIINAVLKNPEDRTQISLLYANQTSDDILLRRQLDALAEKHDTFRVWHTSEQFFLGSNMQTTAASGTQVCRCSLLQDMPTAEPMCVSSRIVPEHMARSGCYISSHFGRWTMILTLP